MEETSWTCLLGLTSLILGDFHRPKSNLSLFKLLEMICKYTKCHYDFKTLLSHHFLFCFTRCLSFMFLPSIYLCPWPLTVTLIPTVTPTTLSRPATLTRCVFLPWVNATCHWEASEPPARSYTLEVKRMLTFVNGSLRGWAADWLGSLRISWCRQTEKSFYGGWTSRIQSAHLSHVAAGGAATCLVRN